MKRKNQVTYFNCLNSLTAWPFGDLINLCPSNRMTIIINKINTKIVRGSAINMRHDHTIWVLWNL